MKSTGVKEEILDWFWSKYSSLIGALERAYEVYLIIPVIYRVVRWDYSSIFIILHHWLQRMEEVQRNDPYHMYADRRADEILTCTFLLKRIIDDEYDSHISWEEYKKLPVEERVKLYKHNEYLRNQDITMLFDIIKRKHGGWWT